jgi:hypothetical protein
MLACRRVPLLSPAEDKPTVHRGAERRAFDWPTTPPWSCVAPVKLADGRHLCTSRVIADTLLPGLCPQGRERREAEQEKRSEAGQVGVEVEKEAAARPARAATRGPALERACSDRLHGCPRGSVADVERP